MAWVGLQMPRSHGKNGGTVASMFERQLSTMSCPGRVRNFASALPHHLFPTAGDAQRNERGCWQPAGHSITKPRQKGLQLGSGESGLSVASQGPILASHRDWSRKLPSLLGRNGCARPKVRESRCSGPSVSSLHHRLVLGSWEPSLAYDVVMGKR